MKKTVVSTIKQRGTSLVEVLGYLAVAGVILAIVGGLIAYAFQKTDSNNYDTALKTAKSEVKQYLQNSSNYGVGNINTPLINAGAIPKFFTQNPTTGVINVPNAGTLVITSNATTVDFVVTALPKSRCVQHLAGLTADTFLSAKVGTGSAQALPLSLTAANTACSAAANDVTYTMG